MPHTHMSLSCIRFWLQGFLYGDLHNCGWYITLSHMVALSYNSSSVGVATAGFSTYIILCCVDKGCVHVLLNAVVHPTPLTAYCWHSDFGPWGTYMRFATVCLFAIQTAFYRAHITTTISACVSALTMLALRYNLTLPRHCCTVHHAPRLLYTHKTC